MSDKDTKILWNGMLLKRRPFTTSRPTAYRSTGMATYGSIVKGNRNGQLAIYFGNEPKNFWHEFRELGYVTIRP